MSEGSRGQGRKGDRPEGGQAGPFPGPGGGGSASLIGWIVSANVLALVALVIAVVALVFYITEDDEESGAPAAAQPSPAVQPTPTQPAVVEVSVDDDPFTGPEDAAVTIIEFSDYQ